MNGRVFAVNRSPVLAWNVEPQLQVPYPDMPAAAAAAISPIVPAASDPYGRCWQNQVDAGTSFPYFGALYNNSLPPTAYRLQPGCMANLGQFWPPTPPPDGCGRFDGSNLYFGPPVLRHGENIPSNLRNSFQGLGHYSHLVETPKEPTQRAFKQETPISPSVSASNISIGSSVTKSDNLNTYCVVDSKLKSQGSIASSLPKQEIISVPSSGHESYLCAPDARSSSSMHPSTDKACFSPSYSMKNSFNFHSSQDNNAHKAKALSGTQENNCNASPLKNVYFSHYESENVNSVSSKNFDKSSDGQYRFEHKNSSLDVNKSKHPHQSTSSFVLHNNYSPKKYDFQGTQEFCSINSNCNVREKQGENIVLVTEQYRQKNNVCKVKPEKNNHADCKFQKSGSKSSTIVQVTECRNSSDVFNIPTSVMHPKIEPNDKYFLPSCSSTAQSCMVNSYSNSGPYLLAKDFATDLRTGASYRNMIYPNSCSLSKQWQYSELPIVSPDNYFKAPEAAKPPIQGPPHSNSALHEGLISVAQTAPQDIDVLKSNGKLQQGANPMNHSKKVTPPELDDEVQIIGVQTKHHSSSKSSSRTSLESKVDYQPVSIVEPLCLKNEKVDESSDKIKATSSCNEVEENVLQLKSELVYTTENAEQCSAVDKVVDDAETRVENFKLANGICNQLGNKVSDKNYNTVVIKKEESCEDIPELDKSSFEKSVNSHIKEQDQEENVSLKVRNDVKNCSSNACVSVDVKEDVCNINVPTSDFNENHGLTLLLNTIEKVASLEKSKASLRHSPVKLETPEKESELEKTGPSFPELSKACGLDLLSVIAGQRLVTEFDDVKCELDELSSIKSNYPEMKQEDKVMPDDIQLKTTSETSASQKSSVFEMQDRLVELQKKYKQKQKELSRLKPKKRLTNTYLKTRQNTTEDNDLCASNNEPLSSDMNSSSSNITDNEVLSSDSISKETMGNAKAVKVENNDVEVLKTTKRRLPTRKSVGVVISEHANKRITRRTTKLSLKREVPKSDEEATDQPECTKKITRNSNKVYKLRRNKDCNLSNATDDDVQVICSNCETPTKDSSKKSVLPESEKNMKVYSLRHSSQSACKKYEKLSNEIKSAACSKTISSKRKSDNPKKFMPSKQSKLSETIIAKHLRSRILFDTSGSVSDDDNLKDGGVPEELYDALMKCHLGEEGKKAESVSKSLHSKDLRKGPLGIPEPSKLKKEHLSEKQRLLALEEGLFYAGYIKEVQVNDRYGIALDGQRGNRLHVFTQEELLTQTIVESKPLSSELPEGTRVCAYWSQQYRCLYPGVVGKAPCPSADWSEPRVFVLFDDGDSGQIPIKNIRLIPPDIISSESEHKLNSQTVSAKCSENSLKASTRGQTLRRLRCSTSKIKNCDTGNENESKESSCGSINDSSCDDSCFIDYSLSPSQSAENHNFENSTCSLSNSADTAKLEKRQRKRSKRKTSCRIKFKELDTAEVKEKCEAKLKRHKKYKDKHRRHHHHHHHHRHHHHHHHHSKKRKHRRRNGKNLTSQDLENENFIPCNVNHKSFKNFHSEAEICTDHVEHSSTVNLPQNEQDRVC